MDKTEVLTIEEIDARMGENIARLEVIRRALGEKTAELGSARGWRLSTVLIHREIDKLEHERRELTAEQEFLQHEHQSMQREIAQRAAESAAAEYNALLEELNPRAVEIINGLYAVQGQLLELEKIQTFMQEKAASAGKLVVPMLSSGAIIIRVDSIKADVYRALSQIIAFNGREAIERAGITIVDMYEESDRTMGAPLRVGLAVERVKPEPDPTPSGFTNTARKAAGLPVE